MASCLLGVAAAALAACAGPARAQTQTQTSLSASLVSDYRYRGLSLSGQEAATQLFLNVDHVSGAYAGASLSRVRLRFPDSRVQTIVYAGFARRFGTASSVDAGASVTHFDRDSRYGYRELYVGVGMERASARLSVSPHYFGIGGRTAYAEINGSMALSGQVDLVGHAGYLRPIGHGRGERNEYSPPARTDLRVGVSAAIDAWTLQLAWTATREGAILYPGAFPSNARRFVVSTARAF